MAERTEHRAAEFLEAARVYLAQRPPDAAFTAAEAAIYTGRSTRTLKRAIDAGVGPRREKNPDISGLGATNRHTRYRKADLDAWRESLVAFATDFRTFDDLVADAPWFVDGGQIVGHLRDLVSTEAVLRVLEEDAVVFERLHEALQRAWRDGERRKIYQEQFEQICRDAMRATADAGQQDALEAETGRAMGASRAPLRP